MKTVGDLLSAKDISQSEFTAPETSVYVALEQMARGNFGALPVFRAGELVGIFSERDCARKVELLGREAKSTRVSDVMTTPVTTISPEHSVEDCMKLMIEKGYRHLPVLSSGKFLGFLSMKDAVKAVLTDRDNFLSELGDLGAQKGEAIAREKAASFQALVDTLRKNHEPLAVLLKELTTPPGNDAPAAVQTAVELRRVLGNFEVNVRAAVESLEGHKKLDQVKVLLANGNRSEEVLAKLALGGTGVTLHTAGAIQDAETLLDQHHYDIVCVNHELIDIAVKAHEQNPNVSTIFLTSEDAERYLPSLKTYPFLSNIVSHSESDRAFTIKSIHAAVSKIATSDYFGLEKYLSWGTEIKEMKISGSNQRARVTQEASAYFSALGLRRTLVDRCSNVSEELLMNAIYDAPTHSSGKHLYNHLTRDIPVTLEPKDQPIFRYGCDGMFLGISVRDPFGSLNRETILEYLESCFVGRESEHHKDKGGGGHGLFIILRSANMTIFNVKNGESTEVISLFDLEPKPKGVTRTSSFQYFSV